MHTAHYQCSMQNCSKDPSYITFHKFVLMLTHYKISEIYFKFNFVLHLGENGKPVNVSKNSLNEEEKEEYEMGWKNNAFNEYLSNRISLDRTLEDPRDEK